MTREEIAQYIKSELANDDPEIYLDIDDYKTIVQALEQIPKLQNRCHALTHGLMCGFCSYECEHKAKSETQESENI